MRGLFSGNRHAAPLGPPKSPPPTSPKSETLQAVRLRQREKQRQYVHQMLRAEKRREVAQSSNQEQEVASAEVQRKQMSDAADRLAQQIMIIERIMEEFGLTLDLEEETRVGQEELMESKEMYEGGLREAEEAVRDVREGTYVSTMAEPFMMPSDVYDEDEAMRDLDETAKQTGLT